MKRKPNFGTLINSKEVIIIKKITVLICVVILSLLCCFELVTSSNSFKIDYSKLELRYWESIELKTQEKSKIMTLSINNNMLNLLPFDLSGEYYLEKVNLYELGLQIQKKKHIQITLVTSGRDITLTGIMILVFFLMDHPLAKY